MGEAYIGQIRIFGGNFAPRGWELCQGQLLPISGYEALFSLIGTTYGGDGQSTFALPDLRGRLPVHQGNGYVIGQTFGVETVTLSTSQIPAHNHSLAGSSELTSGIFTATATDPTNNVVGKSSKPIYANSAPTTDMNQQAISPSGATQPHTNIQPFLCMNFIICLEGIYPQQS